MTYKWTARSGVRIESSVPRLAETKWEHPVWCVFMSYRDWTHKIIQSWGYETKYQKGKKAKR